MNTSSNHILWYFTFRCMNENIVFTDIDFYNFSKACNLKVDEDYEPPTFKMKREKYEIDEGSASSESDYEVEMDEDGFLSLK